MGVPWAESNAWFTGLFEALAINWLKEANLSAVSRLMRLSWHEVDGIMLRAVLRGLTRREVMAPKRMGVDETSFQKRHEYVTVVTDLDDRKVLHVSDNRKAESLAEFYRQLKHSDRRKIAVVAMDMHQPYISATEESVPGADEKIAFDKFHVAKHLGDAVDKVRRDEHRKLMAEGDWTLKNSKSLWLQNPEHMDAVLWESTFKILRESSLQTSRAWARRSQLEPMKKWLRWSAIISRGLSTRSCCAPPTLLPQPRALSQCHLLPPRRP